MWGIQIARSPDAGKHVEWWAERGADARQRAKIGGLLSGELCQQVQR